MISVDDVERARATIAGRVRRTPLLDSLDLGARLKAELLQQTGSFKARGALNRVATLTPEERKRGVVAWSAGNHAQAVGWAAAEEGVDCLVVMSAHASPVKVAATRAYGATVDLEAQDHTEAYERVQAIVAETGRIFVHPHNDLAVIAGHGTLALEILEDAPGVTTVVVGVGGGGLVSGILTALDGRARVIAVEPERAQAFKAGLDAGRSVPVETDTIADGLAPPFAGEVALGICRGRVESVLVTEDEIADGMRFLYTRAKLAAEPAGAAATGAVLAGKVDLDGDVVVVVSGGNALAQQAAAILAA